MSSALASAFSSVTRAALGRSTFIGSTSARWLSVRSIVLSPQSSARSTDNGKEEISEPIKFSTSKASHRTWKVDRALGSQQQRPWRKVLPLSLFGTAFLLWCVLRNNTDIDAQLEKGLHEHFPDLEPDENKSS